MRESQRDKWFYKRCVLIMLCMTLCMTGCSVKEVLGLTGDELFAQMESESLQETRTLSLEELESKEAARTVSENDAEAVSEEAEPEVYSISMGDCLLFEGGSAYAKSKLTAGEKLWYQDIAQILGYMRKDVKLSEAGLKAGLNETDVDRIFQCVLDDHPELFYVEGYTYTKYTRGNKTVAIEFTGTYSQDEETVYARKTEIEQAVAEMLEPARDMKDDYDKIKYVYDTLIETTDYDLEAEDNQNIYSVFVNRSSVCQGYAKAFQYMLNRLGVECTLVQGTVAETGEGHAWNLVKSSGAYYYVDPTWGDISYQNDLNTQEEQTDSEEPNDVSGNESGLPGVSYDYLCITTERLLRTHKLTEPEKMPECKATRDNYYVRERAFFTEYNEEQIAELVDKRIAEGSSDIALQCSSEECYREMQEALLERQEIFTYLAGSGIQSFVYSCNDSQLTLTFFMMTSQR